MRIGRTVIAVATAALLAGCGMDATPTAPDPGGPLLAKKADPGGGKGGGKGGGGDDGGGGTGTLMVEVGLHQGATAEAGQLLSACPIEAGKQWHVDYGHGTCMIVDVDWTWSEEEYPLTDDVRLIVVKESGKNGRITHVRLLAQDVIGEAGVFHSTDDIPVNPAEVPDKGGFTLHVHATGVPVWRHDGHTGGTRVAVIGTISIGDIVYFVQ